MKKKKLVSIVMGSQSDWKTLINCEKIFQDLEVGYEKKIISAHRTPDRLYEFAITSPIVNVVESVISNVDPFDKSTVNPLTDGIIFLCT